MDCLTHIKVYLLTSIQGTRSEWALYPTLGAPRAQAMLVISLIHLRLHILPFLYRHFQVDSLFSVVALVTGGSRGIGKMVSHHPRLGASSESAPHDLHQY